MVRGSSTQRDLGEALKKSFPRRCRACIVYFPLLLLITLAIAILYMTNNGSGASSIGMQHSLERLCTGMKYVPQSDKVIDIDIGTLGTYETRKADLILTFDPFDDLLISEKVERYPYVIADYNGTGIFYENMSSRDCSTMNVVTTDANETSRAAFQTKNCNSDRYLPGARSCAQPLKEHVNEIQVQVRRLCDILKMRGFTKINSFKVDAQGSDFVIVKDLVENCPHVEIGSMKIECQFYERTIPLYVTDNDCTRIERYLKDKFPTVETRFELNVCWSAEYNLVATNLVRPSSQ